jgi:hypothetical protein
MKKSQQKEIQKPLLFRILTSYPPLIWVDPAIRLPDYEEEVPWTENGMPPYTETLKATKEVLVCFAEEGLNDDERDILVTKGWYDLTNETWVMGGATSLEEETILGWAPIPEELA